MPKTGEPTMCFQKSAFDKGLKTYLRSLCFCREPVEETEEGLEGVKKRKLGEQADALGRADRHRPRARRGRGAAGLEKNDDSLHFTLVCFTVSTCG